MNWFGLHEETVLNSAEGLSIACLLNKKHK
jgi:hypothetical protein